MTKAYDYSNRKVIWNPRFINSENDPDFNDFDKSRWNVVAGGSGEYIHQRVRGFSILFVMGNRKFSLGMLTDIILRQTQCILVYWASKRIKFFVNILLYCDFLLF